MTTEERFERIEHVTAGLVELAKSDREENRALWRRTQEQLSELGSKVDTLALKVDRLTVDMDRLIIEAAVRDKESHERDQRLGERVDTLVSAIGQFIAAQPHK